jgi:CheY-like chemotaxis protein
MGREPPKTVLIVDDDEGIRETLSELLCCEGYVTACAANGAEALRVVRESPPGLILLDMMMPVMNGWEFLAQKQLDPALEIIPTVVVSAVVFETPPKAVGCLRKPMNTDLLLELVGQYCR